MKIICDSCKTKYSIADEKVKGKVFKIRCKKCSNIIVVRGNQAAEAEQPEPASFASGGAELKDAPTWHVVIDQKQVGPMTAAEVRERFGRGEIDGDSYIWREGFSDWLRLSQVDVFADIAQTVPVAAPTEMGGDAYEEAPAASGSGGQPQWNAGQPAAEAPSWNAGAAQPAGGIVWDTSTESSTSPASWSAPEPSPSAGGGLFGAAQRDEGGGDLFGSARSGGSAMSQGAASDDGGLFGAVAPAAHEASAAAGSNGGQHMSPAAQAQPAGAAQLTGARNENSVLFSLTNLQALAMGGGGSKSAAPVSASGAGSTDGSGLIDIRAMGVAPAVRRSSASEDGLPDLGGFAAPIAAAPVLMPGGDSERPAWLLPTVIGGGALLLVAVVVIVVLLVVRKPPPPVVVAAPTVPTPTAVQPTAAPAAAQAAEAAQKAAAAQKAETAAAEAKAAGEGTKVAAGKRRGVKGRKGAHGAGTKVAANTGGEEEGAESEGRAPARAKAGGKRDALDDLIDGAVGPSGGRAGGKRAAARGGGGGDDSSLPETLGKAQIQGGMRGIKGRVQGCYDRFKVPGMANVQVQISPSGRVSSARVQGMFAGTPTGACVEAAARAAQFERFRGSPVTITYPFVLR